MAADGREREAWAILHANDSCDHTMCRAPDPRNLDRSCLAQRIADALADARAQAVEGEAVIHLRYVLQVIGECEALTGHDHLHWREARDFLAGLPPRPAPRETTGA